MLKGVVNFVSSWLIFMLTATISMLLALILLIMAK